MDLTSDYPFWFIKNGLVHTYPPLDKDERCDVVVVGAGITGALIADRLTDAGLECVVVDRRDVGRGSTAGNTALIQYELDCPMVELASRISEADAIRVYALNYRAVDWIGASAKTLGPAVGYAEKSSLYIASTNRDAARFPQECELRRKAGIDAACLNRSELKDRFQIKAPAALLSARAATCDPYRFAHLLLRQAVQRGARVYDRTEVTQFSGSGRGTHLRTGRGSVIRALDCVIATGYEATKLLNKKYVRLRSTYAAVTQPHTDFGRRHSDWIGWETRRPYLYFRTTSDHRLMFGGEDDDFDNPRRRDARIRKKVATLSRKVRRLIEGVDFEVEFGWAGTFGETDDGIGYIGQLKHRPHFHFALGFGGNGITLSAIAARMIVDSIRGQNNQDMKLFRFER